MQLQLTRADYFNRGISLHFILTNNRPELVNLGYDLFTVISVTDNRGNRFSLGSIGNGSNCGGGVKTTIKSGQSLGVPNNDGDICNNLWALGDVSSPAVTRIIIRVSGMSSINGATWIIPDSH
jgi:hypothetical protein